MIKKLWNRSMNCLYQVIKNFLKLFSIEINNNEWNKMEQFIKFILVGCSNTLVLLLVYYIVIVLIGEKYYIIGQSIGYVLGVFNSYFWNSKYVFVYQENKYKSTFVKMCLCYVSTYFLQTGILFVFIELLKWSELIAPILTIIITTPINFILNKMFAFKE